MPQITIQFLDVGQGDGIYIEFPNGVNMLVDLGSTKNKRKTGPDISQFFKTYTRFKTPGQTLNYFIITHPDRDHYNMVSGFLKTLKPKVEFYAHGGKPGVFSDLTWRDDLEEAGAKRLKFASLPTPIKYKDGFGAGVEVWCLACSVGGDGADGWTKNTNSIVLQIVYNGTKVMLTGDATWDTENWILERFKKKPLQPSTLQSEVLKVAHHGSARTSSCKEWIAAVNPEFVFISSDRFGSLDINKSTGHRLPQELTLDLIRKYATRLSKCEKHSYVASYDPIDYVLYNKKNKDAPLVDQQLSLPNPFNKKQKGWPPSWYTITTPDSIFTTLVTAGESLEADQGCQYQCTISDAGAITVFSTEDFKTVSTVKK